MRQRWLFILTLFLLSLGLGSLSLLTTPDEPQPVKKPRLTTLDPKQVQTIRIDRLNKDTIVFQKDAQGAWQVREPYQLPANRFRVENILTLLTSSQYSPLTGDHINLAELNLNPALVTVTFDNLTIRLGLVSPFNDGRRYALVQDKVYLLLDTIYRFLTDDAALAISLFPLGEETEITELHLPDLHLKQQDGLWKLQHTDTVGFSADDLTNLVDSWQHLQAISASHYQASPVLGMIEITTSNNVLHFELQGIQPEFILGRPEKGIRYYLPPSQVKTLLGKSLLER